MVSTCCEGHTDRETDRERQAGERTDEEPNWTIFSLTLTLRKEGHIGGRGNGLRGDWTDGRTQPNPPHPISETGTDGRTEGWMCGVTDSAQLIMLVGEEKSGQMHKQTDE